MMKALFAILAVASWDAAANSAEQPRLRDRNYLSLEE